MTHLTLSLNSANFGGSPLLNNLMGSGLEVVSVFVFTFALKHHGRKKTLVLVLGLLGCICVATPLAKKGKQYIATTQFLNIEYNKWQGVLLI